MKGFFSKDFGSLVPTGKTNRAYNVGSLSPGNVQVSLNVVVFPFLIPGTLPGARAVIIGRRLSKAYADNNGGATFLNCYYTISDISVLTYE